MKITIVDVAKKANGINNKLKYYASYLKYIYNNCKCIFAQSIIEE